MSKIAYDPIKDKFARFIKRSRLSRTVFYRLLDMFFLRSWHVRKHLRTIFLTEFQGKGNWDLIDAGSGFGQYDRFILRNFPNVTVKSVDVKDDYLADSKHYFAKDHDKGRITFETADLLKYDQPESYDMAICIDVLEHIEEDVLVMTNLRKALRPGGYFIMHSPSIYAEEDAGDDEFFVDEHARVGYSIEDISGKLEQAGLMPVHVHYTYGTSGHRAWEWLIKYPMLWMTNLGFWVALFLPLYYAFTLIPGLLMMRSDLYSKNEKGTGICAVARKV